MAEPLTPEEGLRNWLDAGDAALTEFEWGRNGVGTCSWCGTIRGTSDRDAHERDCPLRRVRSAFIHGRTLDAARAAAPVGLDVERLARALHAADPKRYAECYHGLTVSGCGIDAEEIAAEYARLAATDPIPYDKADHAAREGVPESDL